LEGFEKGSQVVSVNTGIAVDVAVTLGVFVGLGVMVEVGKAVAVGTTVAGTHEAMIKAISKTIAIVFVFIESLFCMEQPNETVEKAYFAFWVTGESPTFQPENGWTGLGGFR